MPQQPQRPRQTLREERDALAARLAQFDADRDAGVDNPQGYRAEFYRQQIQELDELIRQEDATG